MASGPLSRSVYSTDHGRLCPGCGCAIAACACRKASLAGAGAPSGDGTARVRLETKGRGGKAVTAIRGLPLNPADLEALGKQLRTACGTGGTCKQGELELQGDHVAKVLFLLQQRGFRAKQSGG